MTPALDIHRTIHAVHIEHLLEGRTSSADQVKPKSNTEIYTQKKTRSPPCMKLHDVQAVDFHKSNVIVSSTAFTCVVVPRTPPLTLLINVGCTDGK
jgi:hypothetical protein